jgi:hypothetical protein
MASSEHSLSHGPVFIGMDATFLERDFGDV